MTKWLERITYPYSHVERVDKKDGPGACYERCGKSCGVGQIVSKRLSLNRTLTVFTSLIYQSFISMRDSPEQTPAVSSHHTCALVGSNLSDSDITRLVRAENWVAQTSKAPDSLDTDQLPESPGWSEKETANAAKFREGATAWVVADLTKSCLACSVGLITLLSDADLLEWHCKTRR